MNPSIIKKPTRLIPIMLAQSFKFSVVKWKIFARGVYNAIRWNAIEMKTARNRFLFIEDLNMDFEVLQLKTRNISNTTEEVTTIVLALAISVIFQ